MDMPLSVLNFILQVQPSLQPSLDSLFLSHSLSLTPCPIDYLRTHSKTLRPLTQNFAQGCVPNTKYSMYMLICNYVAKLYEITNTYTHTHSCNEASFLHTNHSQPRVHSIVSRFCPASSIFHFPTSNFHLRPSQF